MIVTQQKRESHHSLGKWCQQFWFDMDRRMRALYKFIFNWNQRQILGRDGQQWSKLAAFYFFFFVGLAGFFCLYLSVFMSFLPLNQPRYIGKESRLTSRANPLSPGLSFRPQANFDPNDIFPFLSLSSHNRGVGTGRRKRSANDDLTTSYVNNLNEFLQVHYDSSSPKSFVIKDVGNCTSNTSYGFIDGTPCILIKMNKIVDFVPERENINESPTCSDIPLQCMGEYIFDQEVLGPVTYYSESGSNNECGSFNLQRFPYAGKIDRQDVYQAPYVWVQFKNLTPHVLIYVECRIYGANIFYDKQTQRGSVRFQMYLNKD